MDRTPSYLNPVLLGQVQRGVEKNSWKVTAAPSPPDKQIYHVLDNQKTARFEIHPNRLSTKQDDRETFVAMLKSYQQMHGAKQPTITCAEKSKDLWISAYKEVYKGNEAKIEDVINVGAAKQAPKQPEASPLNAEPARRPKF